jgi:hypothetical protein
VTVGTRRVSVHLEDLNCSGPRLPILN